MPDLLTVAKPHERVRCIDGTFDLKKWPELKTLKLPKLNEIYTVRKVVMTDRGGVGYWLDELINPGTTLNALGQWGEASFRAERFELVRLI